MTTFSINCNKIYDRLTGQKANEILEEVNKALMKKFSMWGISQITCLDFAPVVLSMH